MIDRLVAHVRHGNWIETSAHLEGLSVHLMRDWLLIGARAIRGDDPATIRWPAPPHGSCSQEMVGLCSTLCREIKRADAENERDAVARLTRWGAEDWMAHQSRMERRWPRRWARPPQRVEVSGPDGGAVESRLVLSWPGRAGLAEPATVAAIPHGVDPRAMGPAGASVLVEPGREPQPLLAIGPGPGRAPAE